jgi:hypothetical protein
MTVDIEEYDGLVGDMRDGMKELRRQLLAGGYCGGIGPMEWMRRTTRKIDRLRLRVTKYGVTIPKK